MSVLQRDARNREVLWQCHECGKAYTRGWGDYCNSCIATLERHREMLDAIAKIAKAEVSQ